MIVIIVNEVMTCDVSPVAMLPNSVFQSASSELCEFIKTCQQFPCSQYIQDNRNEQQSCHTSQYLNNTAQPENIIRKLFFIVFINFTWLARPLGSHCPGCPFGNRCLLPHLPDASQGLPAMITKDKKLLTKVRKRLSRPFSTK